MCADIISIRTTCFESLTCSDVVAAVLMKAQDLCRMTQCILVYASLLRPHFLPLSSGGYLENEVCLSGRSSSNLLRVNGHGVMCRKTGFCSCTGQSPEDRHKTPSKHSAHIPARRAQSSEWISVQLITKISVQLITKLVKLTADCTCSFCHLLYVYVNSCYLHLLSVNVLYQLRKLFAHTFGKYFPAVSNDA
jgi:hypothetical protein